MNIALPSTTSPQARRPRRSPSVGRRLRLALSLVGGALAFGLAAPAVAQANASASAQALHTRALAATCANCHGTDGQAVQGGAMVRLAGLPKSHIVAQMKAFKDGSRPATVMHQLAKGYSDAQIDAIATYLASVK
jgi:cytochrome subunit of sulfide dehydrogenase